MVQLLEAAIVPPTSLMPTSPTVIVPPPLSVKVPPQVLEVTVSNSVMAPGLVGNTSVKVTPVSATGVKLTSVMVKAVVALTATGLVPKLLLISGKGTDKVALAAAALEPALVVRPPAGMVLV
jgi:hypothetical protein